MIGGVECKVTKEGPTDVNYDIICRDDNGEIKGYLGQTCSAGCPPSGYTGAIGFLPSGYTGAIGCPSGGITGAPGFDSNKEHYDRYYRSLKY